MSVETLAPLLLAAGIGYLLGSFPSGYIFVRLFTGTDVRQVGSGRTGGTNVFRAAGKAPMFLTALSDIAKAFVAVLVARAIFNTRAAEAVAGVFAITGHIWSLFLGFRGGGGVGTAAGSFTLLAPFALLCAVPVFWIVLYLWRYASLASLVAISTALLLQIALYLTGQSALEFLWFSIAAWLLIVFAHRGNIQRLLAGTERRVGAPR